MLQSWPWSCSIWWVQLPGAVNGPARVDASSDVVGARFPSLPSAARPNSDHTAEAAILGMVTDHEPSLTVATEETGAEAQLT